MPRGYVFDIVCFVFLECAVLTDCWFCDPEWSHWEEGGSCYLTMDTDSSLLNLTSAARVCQDADSLVVSVSTPEEWRFLNDSGQLKLSSGYWLGMTRDAPVSIHQSLDIKRSGWRWLDGSNTSWSNWDDSRDRFEEPTGISKCVMMSSDGLWSDEACDSKFGYICEKGDTNIMSRSAVTVSVPSVYPEQSTAWPVKDKTDYVSKSIDQTGIGFPQQNSTIGERDSDSATTINDRSSYQTEGEARGSKPGGQSTAAISEEWITKDLSSPASSSGHPEGAHADTGSTTTGSPTSSSGDKTLATTEKTNSPDTAGHMTTVSGTNSSLPRTDSRTTDMLTATMPSTSKRNTTRATTVKQTTRQMSEEYMSTRPSLENTGEYNTTSVTNATKEPAALTTVKQTIRQMSEEYMSTRPSLENTGEYNTTSVTNSTKETAVLKALGPEWVLLISISSVFALVIGIILSVVVCSRIRKNSRKRERASSGGHLSTGKVGSKRVDGRDGGLPLAHTYAASLPTPSSEAETRMPERNSNTLFTKKKTGEPEYYNDTTFTKNKRDFEIEYYHDTTFAKNKREFEPDYYNDPDSFPY